MIRCQDKNILLTETLYKKLLPSHAKKDFAHIQKRLLIYTKNYPHIQKVILSYNNVHLHKKFRFNFFYFYCFIYEKSKCEIMYFFLKKITRTQKKFLTHVWRNFLLSLKIIVRNGEQLYLENKTFILSDAINIGKNKPQ